MGGPFIANIQAKPSSFDCPDCKTTYALPTNFYSSPIKSVPLEELSAEHQLEVGGGAKRRSFLLPAIFVGVFLFILLQVWQRFGG